MRNIAIYLIFSIFAGWATTFAQNNVSDISPEMFEAGSVLYNLQLQQENIDTWFTIEEISNETLARITGKSLKPEYPGDITQLRYIRVLHKNLEGQTLVGEMICNAAIADDLIDIFKTLYLADYPIERMVLIDEYDADDERSMTANNSSCFNFRTIANQKKLSNHALGLAVDINPLYNPYVKTNKGKTLIQPVAGTPYVDRTKETPYSINRDDLCYKEFIKHGFTWGGDWKSLKDYQHFEKLPR